MGDQLWNLSINDIAVPVNATDSAANMKSIFELPAPTNQPLRIAYLDLTFDGTSSTAKPALFNVIRATATGTFPSSNLAPEPFNGDGAAASTLVTASNVKWGTATAEGTVASGNGWGYYRLPTNFGLVYQMALDDELWLPKGTFLRIRAVVASAVNVTINVRWKE